MIDWADIIKLISALATIIGIAGWVGIWALNLTSKFQAISTEQLRLAHAAHETCVHELREITAQFIDTLTQHADKDRIADERITEHLRLSEALQAERHRELLGRHES